MNSVDQQLGQIHGHVDTQTGKQFNMFRNIHECDNLLGAKSVLCQFSVTLQFYVAVLHHCEQVCMSLAYLSLVEAHVWACHVAILGHRWESASTPMSLTEREILRRLGFLAAIQFLERR